VNVSTNTTSEYSDNVKVILVNIEGGLTISLKLDSDEVIHIR